MAKKITSTKPSKTKTPKKRNPPSKFTAKQGDVVSVIFKSFDFFKKEPSAQEVTAFVKDKTRMIYLQIFEVDLGNGYIKYQIRKRYINPSQVVAVKPYEPKTTLVSEYDFVQFVKNNEKEYKRAIENGKE